MIIKGGTRSGPQALAPYLENAEKNERVEVVEIRGTVAQDLIGALTEMDTLAEGTRCTKPLYHAQISPEPPYRLSPEQRLEAVDALEKKMGFEGHARTVVVHEKLGREHIHVVWSRIDLETMRAVPDSHNFAKHEEVSRDLERLFGHPRVQGAHAERDGVERPERSPSRAELRQEERSGIKSKDVKREVTELFRASDTAPAFRAALDDKGYVLAKGDSRDFVIVDTAGGVHSLARRIEGVKAAELREFMKPVARENLPTIDEARTVQTDRAKGLTSSRDEMGWEDALAASAIEKAKRDDKIEAERNWEIKKGRRKDHGENLIEAAYAQGDGFAAQSGAATKHAIKRWKAEKKRLRPQKPQIEKSAYERMKQQVTQPPEEAGQKPSAYERMKAAMHGIEMTDRRSHLLDRISQTEGEREKEDREPDRQNTASGGGRTRSR